MAIKKPAKRTQTKSSRKPVVSRSAKSEPSFQMKRVAPIIFIAVVSTALVLLRNQFVVANVNGQPITRFQLVNELEKKDGKTVLDSLVTKELVMQEAHKRKITVSTGEVNSQIADIEKSVKSQGATLDDLLAQQNLTRADLMDQIKIQLMLKKMVGSVKVTDKEINDYIAQNKDSMPQDTKPEDLKSQVKTQLEQQKLNDKIQAFLSDLQKKAKVQYLFKFQ